MIKSEWKPIEEITEYLKDAKNVFILGCDGCANASGTGGMPQVREMKGNLEKAGKKVTGVDVIDFLCQKALVISRLTPRGDEMKAADAVLTLCCGIGTQAVAAVVAKQVHPGCNTISLGGERGEWQGTERCMECGDCLLHYTGGICPLTACTKSLTNGACGGAKSGKCEIGQEKDCGWELIYNRLKALGKLELLKQFIPPKKYAKMDPKLELMATSVWALEQND